MKKDEADGTTQAVTNPVWPTAEQAVAGSQAYRSQATSTE